MITYLNDLTKILTKAFKESGFETDVTVRPSDRPDLSDFQCNDALKLAKKAGRNPREIAEKIKSELKKNKLFETVSVDGPGFLNMKMTDGWFIEYTNKMIASDRLNLMLVDTPQKTIIDYGGPNVAKPLHVGHLRSAVIGEAIKRIVRFAGNEVIGDTHFGDWGLQMGLVFAEIDARNIAPIYFDKNTTNDYPKKSPVTMKDLSEIYPFASAKSKKNEAFLKQARLYTKRLQDGEPGLRALWKHCHDTSMESIKKNYDDLSVHFDLWMGESDVHDRLMSLLETQTKVGKIIEDNGAKIISIARDEDKKNMPPVLMQLSTGAVGYHATDMATLEQRVDELKVDRVIYLTDNRQALHFEQVFRGAEILGIIKKDKPELKYIGFGTMNGKDGKPFKTRDGGVVSLDDLIETVRTSGLKKVKEAGIAEKLSKEGQEKIALQVGVAALKFADLINPPVSDYVFDIDAFTRFDGKTGPYIQYTAVRIKSLLEKTGERQNEQIQLFNEYDRALAKECLSFQEAFAESYEKLSPHILCGKAYKIASTFNTFYHHCHILTEKDKVKREGWIAIAILTLKVLETFADLIGIDIPERM